MKNICIFPVCPLLLRYPGRLKINQSAAQCTAARHIWMLVSLIKVLLQWGRLLRNSSCLWSLKIAKGNIKRKKKRHFKQISPFTCFSLGIFAENKGKQITQIHFQWVQHAMVMFPPFGQICIKELNSSFVQNLKLNL